MPPDSLTQQETSAEEIAALFERYGVAVADANVAGQSADGRYVDAYTAGFLLAKTVVRASGYRVRGGENHRDTLSAVPWLMGSAAQESVDVLEAARRQRNIDLYDGAGTVEDGDVGDLLECVAGFEAQVRRWMAEHHADLFDG